MPVCVAFSNFATVDPREVLFNVQIALLAYVHFLLFLSHFVTRAACSGGQIAPVAGGWCQF